MGTPPVDTNVDTGGGCSRQVSRGRLKGGKPFLKRHIVFFSLHRCDIPLATEALQRIGALYALEAEIRGQLAEARKNARQVRGRGRKT